MTGFEPARVSPLTPEISVSTSFTTSAVLFYNSSFIWFVQQKIKKSRMTSKLLTLNQCDIILISQEANEFSSIMIYNREEGKNYERADNVRNQSLLQIVRRQP